MLPPLQPVIRAEPRATTTTTRRIPSETERSEEDTFNTATSEEPNDHLGFSRFTTS